MSILLPAAEAFAQGKQPAPEKPQSLAELHIIRLKHADATEVAGILANLLQDMRGKSDQSPRTAVDMRTNCVIISARPATFLMISELVRKLDEPAANIIPPRQIQLFTLKSLAADENLVKVLKPLFNAPSDGSFSIDPVRNAVVAVGAAAKLEEVAALLERLDQPLAKTDVNIRILWLVSGNVPQDAAKPPDDMKDVVAQLAKLGIKDPRLAAQTIVASQIGKPFQVQGLASLTEMYNLQIEGRAMDKQDRISLEMKIQARQQGGFLGSGILCNLDTVITTPVGHSTVLGVTPALGLTSVFVVQVQQ
jgi:hypothetical protein